MNRFSLTFALSLCALGCTRRADLDRVCGSWPAITAEPLPEDRVAAQHELIRRLRERSHDPYVKRTLRLMDGPPWDVQQYAPAIAGMAKEEGLSECPLATAWEARYPDPFHPSK